MDALFVNENFNIWGVAQAGFVERINNYLKECKQSRGYWGIRQYSSIEQKTLPWVMQTEPYQQHPKRWSLQPRDSMLPVPLAKLMQLQRQMHQTTLTWCHYTVHSFNSPCSDQSSSSNPWCLSALKESMSQTCALGVFWDQWQAYFSLYISKLTFWFCTWIRWACPRGHIHPWCVHKKVHLETQLCPSRLTTRGAFPTPSPSTAHHLGCYHHLESACH